MQYDHMTDYQRLQFMVRQAKKHEAPCLPLCQAALAGHIRLIALHDPEQPWPAVQVALAGTLPTVVLVCDDPFPTRPAVGPIGWLAAASLRHWPRSAVIHGSGPQRWHYDAAILAAQTVGRVAFVETSTLHVEPWAQFLAVRCVIVEPPDGGLHPQAAHPASAAR